MCVNVLRTIVLIWEIQLFQVKGCVHVMKQIGDQWYEISIETWNESFRFIESRKRWAWNPLTYEDERKKTHRSLKLIVTLRHNEVNLFLSMMKISIHSLCQTNRFLEKDQRASTNSWQFIQRSLNKFEILKNS